MKKLLTAALISGIIAQNGFALTRGAQTLVEYETKSNAVSTRDNHEIQIPHFEIPLSMLELDFANRFSTQIKKHLIFTKDGIRYVRWILNPEDTQWHKEVSDYFQGKGIHLEKKYYFIGRQTASRSYIVEDPQHEIQFSVKSSTDKTGGHWSDKKQPVGEAVDSRLNADFLANIQEKLSFQNIVIMDEPAIMKLKDIDQAVVIRDLAGLNYEASGKIYVPGFSVLHESTGKEIALKNGSNDPHAFWTEHYIKAVGRALGEFAARTGMQFDSPHSQNFLVELDANYKPTGRIVFRDLADLYIYQDFIKAVHPKATKYLETFTQRGNILGNIAAGFGPLHGNRYPSWISKEQYSAWKNDFFAAFEQSFSSNSGLSLSSFKATEGRQYGDYYGNGYSIPNEESATPTEEVKKFWDNIHKYQSPKGILNCSYVLRL